MTDPITEWLDRNGGPRRFEQGASGNIDSLARYLEDRGYKVVSQRMGTVAKVTTPAGKSSRMHVRTLVGLVDKVRAREGKQPLRRKAA